MSGQGNPPAAAPSRTLPFLADRPFIDPGTGKLTFWAYQALSRLVGTVSGSGGLTDQVTGGGPAPAAPSTAGASLGAQTGGVQDTAQQALALQLAAVQARLSALEAEVAVLLAARPVAQKGQPYDIVAYFDGTLPAGAVVFRLEIVRPVTLPVGLGGSEAAAKVAPTNAVTLPILRNGAGIGSVAFAAGATVGTFTFTASVTLAPGDVLEVDAPSAADPTFAGLSLTLAATRAAV